MIAIIFPNANTCSFESLIFFEDIRDGIGFPILNFLQFVCQIVQILKMLTIVLIGIEFLLKLVVGE